MPEKLRDTDASAEEILKAIKFKVDRVSGTDAYNQIDNHHVVEVLDELIPSLLANLSDGQKLRILDIGGGLCLLSDQIRGRFGDRVNVFSTGLHKRGVKRVRRLQNMKPLHKQDLRWHSILELSDVEEFDLILETYGELNHCHLIGESMRGDRWFNDFYLKLIVSKLRPGGVASLAPFVLCSNREHMRTQLSDSMSRRAAELGVQLRADSGNGPHTVLRVYKPGPNSPGLSVFPEKTMGPFDF